MQDLNDRLRQHIDVLAELIGERNTAHPEAIEAARAYLHRELGAMGFVARDQVFQVHSRRAVNIEVSIVGTKPAKSLLVVGAHYDSAIGTPGADDNASAVAILLEIARSLVNRKLKRSVKLVFFDCEEPPHFNFGEMGSQHHAAELRRAGVKLFGMICLESLGYFTKDAPPNPFLPFPLRWMNSLLGQKYVVIVSNLSSLRFGLSFLARFATSGFFPFVAAALPVRWVPDIELSDHRGYWEQGFSALMVTDTAHLRNPNYHQRTD